MAEITQEDVIKEFYMSHPNRDIKHPEVVDWVVAEYKKRTGRVFRDPDRGIRQLYQDGFLVQVKTGVYRYDPDLVHNRKLEDFTSKQKTDILERDGYKCVVCGRTKQEGAVLHVDHIKPKEKGGQAVIENGQVLCTDHNNIKKIYSQTEFGKRIFIKLQREAQKSKDEKMISFCKDILAVYEKHDMDSHIGRKT